MQTNYDQNRTRQLLGLQVDGRLTEIVTASAGEVLNWGDAVYIPDNEYADDKIVVRKLNAANKAKLFGFVSFEHRQRNLSNQTISVNQDVPIMIKGVIWVSNTAGTIVAGNKLRVDASTVKLQTSAAQTGDVTYHGAMFLTGGAADTLVKLFLNFPNYQQTA